MAERDIWQHLKRNGLEISGGLGSGESQLAAGYYTTQAGIFTIGPNRILHALDLRGAFDAFKANRKTRQQENVRNQALHNFGITPQGTPKTLTFEALRDLNDDFQNAVMPRLERAWAVASNLESYYDTFPLTRRSLYGLLLCPKGLR